MSTGVSNLSFFVKVEGQAHSNYRSPEGIYCIDVVAERTLQHSAYAAVTIAREAVPFFDENSHGCTIRVFSKCGSEISIPRPLHTSHEDKGLFRGRSKNHPESITY